MSGPIARSCPLWHHRWWSGVVHAAALFLVHSGSLIPDRLLHYFISYSPVGSRDLSRTQRFSRDTEHQSRTPVLSHVPSLLKSTEGSSDCHPSRAAAPRRIILAILPARSTGQQRASQVRTLLWGRNRLEHRRPFHVIDARCLKWTETPCLGTIFAQSGQEPITKG